MGPGLCENWQLQGPQVMLLSYYPAQHPGGAGGGERGTSLYSMIVLGFEPLLVENPSLQHIHLFLVSASPSVFRGDRNSLKTQPRLPSSAVGRIFNFIQLRDLGGCVTCEG